MATAEKSVRHHMRGMDLKGHSRDIEQKDRTREVKRKSVAGTGPDLWQRAISSSGSPADALATQRDEEPELWAPEPTKSAVLSTDMESRDWNFAQSSADSDRRVRSSNPRGQSTSTLDSSREH
ncbi:hypothetical protein LTR86_001686 [Recurvomyces mirabilis]|nr:hypothetical protein LTR86_001686 [Recurvomyces mirabilis]